MNSDLRDHETHPALQENYKNKMDYQTIISTHEETLHPSVNHKNHTLNHQICRYAAFTEQERGEK